VLQWLACILFQWFWIANMDYLMYMFDCSWLSITTTGAKHNMYTDQSESVLLCATTRCCVLPCCSSSLCGLPSGHVTLITIPLSTVYQQKRAVLPLDLC
jgi:hypothetical protein